MSAKCVKLVENCSVLPEHPLNVSDHLPVQLILASKVTDGDNSRSGNVMNNVPKVKWHKMSGEDICTKYTDVTNQVFEVLCEKCEVEDYDIELDDMVDEITNLIVKVSKDNLVVNKCKKSNAKPFWNDELSSKLAIRKDCYEAWKNGGKPKHCDNPLLIRLKEAKREFRRTYRRSEAIFNAQIEEKIDACVELDQREFWHLLKKGKKPNKQGHILKDANGNIVSDQTEVSAMWQDHFSKLGQPSANEQYDDNFKEYVNIQLDEFCKSMDEMSVNVLEDRITSDEVKSVCKKLKSGKAQDFTSLQYEHFKYAGDNVYNALSHLFNAIVFKEQLPQVFKKGITLALFKGGDKDPLDQNNFRGITIQSVLCKIYESILVKRSTPVIKEKVNIVDTQSACNKGLSSVHASLMLQETIAHNNDNGSNTYVTFFDTRKAFDTVWVEGLLYMLFINGVKGKLWRLIRLSYMECFSAVCINRRLSAWFKLLQGVKQGAILSMLLYICFINGLLREILESGLGAEVLNISAGAIGYADDLAIVTIDRTAMQALIDIAYEYSCKWRFEFSPSKCAIMMYGKNVANCNFHLGQSKLKTVSEYTHVGITLRSKGKISLAEINKRIQACKRSFYALVGTSLYKTSLSPNALSKLYWSVSIPKLLSGCEVKCYPNHEIKEYAKFHKVMARDIQNLPTNTPDPMVLPSMGWRDIVCHIDFVKLMFVQRILALSSMSIYRIIFLRRLYYIILSGIYNPCSPVAQIVITLYKYNLIDHIKMLLESGVMPSKSEWRVAVKSAIDDKTHSEWRFLLSLYPKLDVYRVIVQKSSLLCWWELVKSLPFLKKACVVIVRLLSGCHILKVAQKLDVDRQYRICDNCDSGKVEDLYHFVVECSKWKEVRGCMFRTIDQSIDIQSEWHMLSLKMKFYLLFGLEYPLPPDELFAIRYSSCVHVLKMYKLRKAAVQS